jgi:hypothetical protein
MSRPGRANFDVRIETCWTESEKGKGWVGALAIGGGG